MLRDLTTLEKAPPADDVFPLLLPFGFRDLPSPGSISPAGFDDPAPSPATSTGDDYVKMEFFSGSPLAALSGNGGADSAITNVALLWLGNRF